MGVLLWSTAWAIAYDGPIDMRTFVEIVGCAAVTGAVVVAAWSWFHRLHLSPRAMASVLRGLVCAIALVAVFEFSAPIRANIAAAWFPYVTSLRFGLLGAFITWAIIDMIVIGAIISLMAKSNPTTRWSGP